MISPRSTDPQHEGDFSSALLPRPLTSLSEGAALVDNRRQ